MQNKRFPRHENATAGKRTRGVKKAVGSKAKVKAWPGCGSMAFFSNLFGSVLI